jgi:Protein-tyrosine-phosphatase-like, N-terminal domain
MPFRDQPMDPISRQTFARSIEALAEKFRGIFSRETVERYVHESIDRLSGARVVDFIPLFVHRFAREQLRALAQSEGAFIKPSPRSCSSVSTTPAAARWPPPKPGAGFVSAITAELRCGRRLRLRVASRPPSAPRWPPSRGPAGRTLDAKGTRGCRHPRQ